VKRHVITCSVGDWNLGISEMSVLAARAGGRYYHGSGPDGAIVTGADRVVTKTLGKYGSDHHHANLFTLHHGDHAVKVIGWNPWMGQRPDSVRKGLLEMIREYQPDVFALQEAYRLRQVLTTIPGYRRHQGLNVGEGADCALLLRRRHAVVNDGVLVMRKGWEVARYDKTRAPRQYPYDRLRISKAPIALRVLDAHFPTATSANAAAVRESADRVVRWHSNGRGEVK